MRHRKPIPGIWGERVPDRALERWGPVIKALVDGKSATATAKLLGESESAVYGVRVRLGLPPTVSKQKILPELEPLLRETLLTLRDAGIRMEECARIVGVCPVVALRLLTGWRRGQKLEGRCEWCGREGLVVVHHESYVPEVVVRVCKGCHAKVHLEGRGQRARGGFSALDEPVGSEAKRPAPALVGDPAGGATALSRSRLRRYPVGVEENDHASPDPL
jgi:hypothetical protein